MTTPTLTRIKSRVMEQIGAFHEAQHAAQNWANASGKRTFVVRNDGRYFLADSADLRCYHRRDIHQRRAEVVAILMPISFALVV